MLPSQPDKHRTTLSSSPFVIGGIWSFSNTGQFDLLTEYTTLTNTGAAHARIMAICVANSTSEINFALSGKYTNTAGFPSASCISPRTVFGTSFRFKLRPGKHDKDEDTVGGSEPLGLVFDPQSPGCKYGTLEIYGNFSRDPLRIDLFGVGFNAETPSPSC